MASDKAIIIGLLLMCCNAIINSLKKQKPGRYHSLENRSWGEMKIFVFLAKHIYVIRCTSTPVGCGRQM